MLPAGLAIDFHTGAISGTPRAGGLFSFSVQATDSSTGTGPFSQAQKDLLTVAAPSSSLARPPCRPRSSAPVYNQPVAVTGGTPRYTYSLFAGVLPAGLTLECGHWEHRRRSDGGRHLQFHLSRRPIPASAPGRTAPRRIMRGPSLRRPSRSRRRPWPARRSASRTASRLCRRAAQRRSRASR